MQDLAFGIFLTTEGIHKCSILRGFGVKENISSFSLPSTLMSHTFTLIFSEILNALAVLYKKSKGYIVELFLIWW